MAVARLNYDFECVLIARHLEDVGSLEAAKPSSDLHDYDQRSVTISIILWNIFSCHIYKTFRPPRPTVQCSARPNLDGLVTAEASDRV